MSEKAKVKYEEMKKKYYVPAKATVATVTSQSRDDLTRSGGDSDSGHRMTRSHSQPAQMNHLEKHPTHGHSHSTSSLSLSSDSAVSTIAPENNVNNKQLSQSLPLPSATSSTTIEASQQHQE